MSNLPPSLVALSAEELHATSVTTLAHYEQRAASFWQGTRDHDVSQNIAALLRHLPQDGPQRILDFGCGPGRDLAAFVALGHAPVGVEGAAHFVDMAKAHARCEVLHQDFLNLDLGRANFDGIFANASLFHVPSQELPRILVQLYEALKPGGVLFSSNPHGPNQEGWSGDRYCCYLSHETYFGFMAGVGFSELEHYYRPEGKPRAEQPWLASVWRKAN